MQVFRRLPRISFNYLALCIVIFFIYFYAGKLGLSFAYLNASASAIWPPTGIAIAVLLLFGYRVAPVIFLGAFFVNLTTQGGVATSIGIASGNMLEGILAVFLVRRFAHGKDVFDHVPDVLKFSILAGFLSTMVSATIGVATLYLGGLAQIQTIPSVWLTWWLGDVGGALGVTPLVFLWLAKPSLRIQARRIVEFSFFLFLIAGMGELVFSGSMPYPYLCISLLALGAFRFNQKEEATALFLLAGISIWNTIHGFGPYAQLSQGINHSLVLLQLFLSTCAITTLTVTAALLERREARVTLQTSEKRFRSLIEKSFDAVVLIDATSKISYASPSVKQLLGYMPEELIGTVGFDLVIEADRPKTIKTLAKLVLKPGGVVTVEYRTIRKDKKIIWVEATGTNLLFDENVGAVVVNFHDITERILSQEKIMQEKAEDEALLASLGEGILATDDKGTITLVNDMACSMLLWKQEDLLGKSLVEVIPMQDGEGRTLPIAQRPMVKVLSEQKKIVTSPYNYYIRSDKTKFPVRFTLTPVLLNKRVIGTIEVFRDITEESEIDKAKSEFVSLASHQLRTPLTTINWYTERLLNNKGAFPPQEKKYLYEVSHASHRMVDLINALLNVSRLELGTFIVEPQECESAYLVKESLRELEPAFRAKGIQVEEHISKNLKHIRVDPKLMITILQNIFSNAGKYSKKGGKVDITISSDTKGYTIKIEDKGYGIPKNDQKNIFTKMFRADNAKILDRDGTGLGLYMVKSIVDKTGGKIWFVSEQNKGTAFFVRYPLSGMKKKAGTKELR